MQFLALLVAASIAATSATGALLRCSEASFNILGGVLPSSTSSSKYTICTGGVVQEMDCPSGRAFDKTTRTCIDSREQAEKINVAKQFEELCTNPDEVQIFPNPTYCSRYIVCFGLVPIELTCSEGLFFNPELNMCDTPANVVCGTNCPQVDDPNSPVWLPDARLEDCARHYLCFQGDQILFRCPSNLYFDLELRTCTYPQLSACRVPGVYCAANRTENVANPRHCSSYYECSEGFPHFRHCAEGEYFYPAVGRCVVGACPSQNGTTNPNTTSPPTINPDEECNGATNGRYPHPINCYQYIQCLGGAGEVLGCPADQIFSPDQRICIPGNQETCIYNRNMHKRDHYVQ